MVFPRSLCVALTLWMSVLAPVGTLPHRIAASGILVGGKGILQRLTE